MAGMLRKLHLLAGWTGAVVWLIGLGALQSGCAGAGQSCGDAAPKPRDATPREVTVLGDDLSPLRTAFNAESDRWRVVALVSPTCSECILGAEAVRKELVDRYGPERLSAIVVWIPMIPSDNERAARASATIFPVGRAVQFYDGKQEFGLAYTRGTFAGFIARARKSLPDGHRLAVAIDEHGEAARAQWDVYMLYAPGVRWDAASGGATSAPPMPTHWIKHSGRMQGEESTYWVDSPDTPPREGDLFEAMREMGEVVNGESVSAGNL